MVDYFHVLGITSNSSDEEVKRKYYQEAKKWHPDTNSSPEAMSRFKLINAAYQELQSSKQRQEYQFEVGPDMYDDYSGGGGSWHQRGRSKWEEDLQKQYRQQFNNVNYEFNQAEQKWQNKSANSSSVKFYRFWEKVIAPRNLFFFIPLGVAAYYVTTSTIKKLVAGHLTDGAEGPARAGGTPSTAAGAGGTSSEGKAGLGPGPGPGAGSGGKNGSVRAWLNPTTQQWETPAPWDPLFKASAVQLVHRSKVKEPARR